MLSSKLAKLLAASTVVTGSGGIGAKVYLKQGKPLSIKTLSPSSEEKVISQVADETTETTVEKAPEVTFGSSLTSSNFKIVTESTTEEVLLNILMERLDPSKDTAQDYNVNRIFTGSKPIKYGVKSFTGKDNKKLTVLQKPDKQYAADHKQACIEELKKPYDQNNSTDKAQLSRLREWCTEPKVRDVLGRHKFTVLKTENKDHDEHWKEIIKGGWFSKTGETKYWDKQSFIAGDELKKIIGDSDTGFTGEPTDDQISVLKNACKAVLDTPFTRENFYLTTDFLSGITGSDPKPKMDPFQEAALFCTQPATVHHYITVALQGTPITPTKADDYCSLSAGDVNSWKTNTPMEGKTFWCGVRIAYGPKKP
ncbi:hypothetical protein [Candidatus Mycoplasma haematohominis]|uniref:hypothetical protein n=1 Tax=Candidatus Mycoplasma haematohominis TaxID=1494318 RepID=UPI001C0A779B|nr:hypothetical protein [Candidatus Mycoplasma haemohominis]